MECVHIYEDKDRSIRECPWQGMKRFVTYIYAYEEGKKGSNVGFARIEIRGQDARIEIHLRGVYAASAACRVYLFQREASGGKEATGVTGVLVGEMKAGEWKR